LIPHTIEFKKLTDLQEGLNKHNFMSSSRQFLEVLRAIKLLVFFIGKWFGLPPLPGMVITVLIWGAHISAYSSVKHRPLEYTSKQAQPCLVRGSVDLGSVWYVFQGFRV
jgi:hypothetical protein